MEIWKIIFLSKLVFVGYSEQCQWWKEQPSFFVPPFLDISYHFIGCIISTRQATLSREMFKGSTAKKPLSQVLYSYVAWLQQLVENGYFDTGVTSGSFNMSRRWQGVRIFRMQLAVSMFIQRKPGNKRDPTTNVCAQKLLIDDLGESCRLHSQTKQFLGL